MSKIHPQSHSILSRYLPFSETQTLLQNSYRSIDFPFTFNNISQEGAPQMMPLSSPILEIIPEMLLQFHCLPVQVHQQLLLTYFQSPELSQENFLSTLEAFH